MSAKRTLVLAIFFAALVSLFGVSAPAQAGVRVGFGISVGLPPPPLRHEVVVVRPGPDYYWVPGYWDWRPAYRDYTWVGGYWRLPPHRHAVWVGPRYYSRYYYRHHHRYRHYYYRRGYWR
jgi:hypothetical protein